LEEQHHQLEIAKYVANNPIDIPKVANSTSNALYILLPVVVKVAVVSSRAPEYK
jgi:hypothetical protein